MYGSRESDATAWSPRIAVQSPACDVADGACQFKTLPSMRPVSVRPCRDARKTALLLVSGLVGLLASSTQHAYSQTSPLTAEETKQLIEQGRHRKSDPYGKQKLKHHGFVVGEWIVLPEINFGGIYDDNLFSAPSHQHTGFGFALQPSLTVQHFTGIHDTTIQAQGDIRLFNESQVNTYSGSLALSHIYEIERGFRISYRGQVARVEDQASALVQDNGGGGPNLIYVRPYNYMSYYSELAATKSFNQVFVGGNLNVYANNFDNLQSFNGLTSDQSRRDFVQYTFDTRGGYRFLPDVYVFVEPSVMRYTFTSGTPDAVGYKILGGIGSDRISLFRAELYGGYQSVSYGPSSTLPDVSGETFGGRLSWTPTRDFIATVSFDHSFTPSTLNTGPVGSFTKADTVAANMVYNYTDRIDLGLTPSYSHATYSTSSRSDDIVRLHLKGDYYITDSWAISLNYYFQNNTSSEKEGNYLKETVILGLRYRM